MNLIRFTLLCLLMCLLQFAVLAQPEPFSYYSLDNGDATDETSGESDGLVTGNPVFNCGASNDGIQFDGVDDIIRFPNNDFSTVFNGDFSWSFYFKPGSGNRIQQVISYMDDCVSGAGFYVTYNPLDQNFSVLFRSENFDLITLNYTLDDESCWYHIVINRRGGDHSLYVNQELVEERSRIGLITLVNSGVLTVAGGACTGTLFDPFQGNLDEIYIFNKALSMFEIAQLDLKVQRILTPDTLILNDGQVNVRVNSACTENFLWSPRIGVDDPFEGQTVLAPDTNTRYTLTFSEGGCMTTDDINILVVDPSQVECENVAFPKAFTPNNDGLNDEFGIANPFIVEEIESFQIFDRWGGVMFESKDPFELWDGTYNGQDVNPGAYYYRLSMVCSDKPVIIEGTVSILR